tara:strand:- start:42 stop:683 length:642 start_codon:yes stop_codon:yes gene_type:complete
MEHLLPIGLGAASGFALKKTINWVDVDSFKINNNNFFLELLCPIPWVWSFMNLPVFDAIIFSTITIALVGISIIDLFTMQIPLIFILIGLLAILLSIIKKSIYISSAVYGIFVGAIIPVLIMGLLWLITKRQGMGYGDIQLGFVLGAWLGPMRMALTLFFASVLSLIAWIILSMIHGFDKNRAVPLGPFLSVAGIGIYVGSFYYPELFHLLII